MDPESKKLLDQTLELEEDNNKMLRSMLRSMRIQRILTILYWVFIVGSAVGAYYVIQPYLAQLMDVYSGAGSILDNFK